MVRSGNIKDYFSKSQQLTSAGPAGPGNPAPPSGTASFPSSPGTPVKAPVKPLSRPEEIRGSDEEDDESDDSIESLSAFFGQKKDNVTPSYRRDTNVTSTPKAKRVASDGNAHRSPLTLQQKGLRKHKFDLKALLRDSAQDDKAKASAQRADDVMKESDDDSNDDDVEDNKTRHKNRDSLKETALDLLGDEEKGKGDKLTRAIDRASTKGSSRRRCYFFDPQESPHLSSNLPRFVQKQQAKPFPLHKARGRWKFLEDPNTRNQAFIHGLPQTVLSKGKELPDELFTWVLNQICLEQNTQLRLKYCNLVARCKDNVHRLVDEDRLYGMLQTIGGPAHDGSSADGHKLESVPEVEEPYLGRDWSSFTTFLTLLIDMAPNLNSNCVIHAIQLLFRMSLDPVIRIVAAEEYATALVSLVEALPDSGMEWNTACCRLASYLLDSLEHEYLLVIPIVALRPVSAQMSDLRRRLATAVLSGDGSWAALAPDSVVTLDNIMARLDEADFTIHPGTDYEALKSLIILLSLVINDAEFLRRPAPSSSLSPPLFASKVDSLRTESSTNPPNSTTSNTRSSSTAPRPDGLAPPPQSRRHPNHHRQQLRQDQKDEQEQQRHFDAQIDRLTARLRNCLHDRIHDNNSPARKEARTAADVLVKRLAYDSRSRPPPKTSIFDDPDVRRRLGLRVEEDEKRERKDLEQRRDFMRGWATAGRGDG